MSDHAFNRDRLLDLVGAVCNDVASLDDFLELDSVVQNNGDARSWYQGYCRLHGTLRLELRANRATQAVYQQIGITPGAASSNGFGIVTKAETPASPAPTFLSTTFHGTLGYFSEGMPLAYLLATVIVGVGLLIGSRIYVSGPEQLAGELLPSTNNKATRDPRMQFVGRITGMVDCQWEKKGLGIRDWGLEEDSRSKAQGSDNPKSKIQNPKFLVALGDRLALSSGLMEITYDTGAKVILQGPVTYEVDSRAGGYLSLGKLTARVDSKAESGKRKADDSNPQSLIPNPSPSTTHYPLFTVKTPTAVVTDLGTEFGVEVMKGGTSHIRVFAGKVNVADQNTHVAWLASAGEAIQVDQTGMQRVMIPEKPTPFVRAIRSLLPMTDAFDDNVIDRAKWIVFLPLKDSRVTELNHRIELSNRGYLVTKKQFDPDASGGITITGQWTFNTPDDTFQILTRSDAVPSGQFGEVANGIEFRYWSRPRGTVVPAIPAGVAIVAHGSHLSVADMSTTGRLTIRAGSTFDFTIIDNGAMGLSLTMTEVGNPANTAAVTAKLATNTASSNYVVFHNREYENKTTHAAFLDNISITSSAIGKPPAK